MGSLRILVLGLFACLLFRMSPAQEPTKSRAPAPSQQPPVGTAAPTPAFAEELRKTVGFLKVVYRNGGAQEGVIGTCFFVSVPDKRLGENRGFTYLVTNRHVAQPGVDLGTPYQVDAAFIRLNLATAQGAARSVEEQIPFGGRTRWFFPSDEAVDLAILPLEPNATKYDLKSIPSSSITNSEQFKAGDVGVGDPVTFAGYFSSFPGQIRIQPIVRQGVIAMLPEEKLPTTLHKPGRLFLADLHAFHGNSGSPVFVNEGGFRRGVIVVEDRYMLLGVLSGYYPESAGFSVPAATVLTGEVRDNSGIATIVPADELTKLLDSDELRADRDSQVAVFLRKKP